MDRSPEGVDHHLDWVISETPFEWVAWIGRGAFAHVAHVRGEGRDLALKVGPADGIRREFELSRRVSDPDAITGERLFIAGPMAAFSMEYFVGCDWLIATRGHMATAAPPALRRNLPMAFGYEMNDLGENAFEHCGARGEERIRSLLPRFARVLANVHSVGLVHLDVAPDNLLVCGDEIRLIDFGLATEPAAYTDRPVGSAGYLAPELGEGRLGPAADWYSLGVCLFQALTGALPFTGGGPEVLVRKQSMSAPRASELCPTVAADLDELCAGLLHRHPGRRAHGADVARLATP